MYGNDHVAHTTGYQSSEMGSNGYSYYQNHHHHLHHNHHLNAESIIAYASHNNSATPNSTPTPTSTSSNSSAMYHPHLYSPSAAEYGITTSNPSPTDHHSYFDGDTTVVHPSFYNPQTSSGGDPQVPAVPETHIISSDNGLSYTNLDYMYSHGHHHASTGANSGFLHEDDKSAVHLTYNGPSHGVAAHPTGQTQHHSTASTIITSASGATWHPHHHGHHHPTDFLDGTSLPSGHQLSLSAMGSIQTQLSALPPGNGRGGLVNHNHQDQSQPQQLHGQQPHQPTYKWMQVKRNVPKPQSELEFISKFNL